MRKQGWSGSIGTRPNPDRGRRRKRTGEGSGRNRGAVLLLLSPSSSPTPYPRGSRETVVTPLSSTSLVSRAALATWARKASLEATRNASHHHPVLISQSNTRCQTLCICRYPTPSSGTDDPLQLSGLTSGSLPRNCRSLCEPGHGGWQAGTDASGSAAWTGTAREDELQSPRSHLVDLRMEFEIEVEVMGVFCLVPAP